MTSDNPDQQGESVSNARSPHTYSAPRTAATGASADSKRNRALGHAATTRLKHNHRDIANTLLTSIEHVDALGSQLHTHIDHDALPSRVELQDDLVENTDLSEDELKPTHIAGRRRAIMLNQLDDDTILSAANIVLDTD